MPSALRCCGSSPPWSALTSSSAAQAYGGVVTSERVPSRGLYWVSFVSDSSTLGTTSHTPSADQGPPPTPSHDGEVAGLAICSGLALGPECPRSFRPVSVQARPELPELGLAPARLSLALAEGLRAAHGLEDAELPHLALRPNGHVARRPGTGGQDGYDERDVLRLPAGVAVGGEPFLRLQEPIPGSAPLTTSDGQATIPSSHLSAGYASHWLPGLFLEADSRPG